MGNVNWVDICALKSSRLIALDKCPGIRPIAIGEEPRRILCKVLAMATGSDVVDLCGVRQVCSGYAIKELYEEHCGNGWGLLLVDALLKKGCCHIAPLGVFVRLFRNNTPWSVVVTAQGC